MLFQYKSKIGNHLQSRLEMCNVVLLEPLFHQTISNQRSLPRNSEF